jgi:hypothetical protein
MIQIIRPVLDAAVKYFCTNRLLLKKKSGASASTTNPILPGAYQRQGVPLKHFIACIIHTHHPKSETSFRKRICKECKKRGKKEKTVCWNDSANLHGSDGFSFFTR